MNFMRKRGEVVGDRPGASMIVRSEEEPGEEKKVWGAFFGQSSLSRKAVVARASVSLFQDQDSDRDRVVG